jgi:Ca2+-binding EF-hand superfamily protein
MRGPTQTHWAIRGQLLVGGHPGLVSQAQLTTNLGHILKEGINLFVCLQEELSTSVKVGSSSSSGLARAGADLNRPRNAYGLRFMTACQPYISDAKLVAGRMGIDIEEIQFMHFPIPEANDAVAIDSDVTRAVRRIVSAIAAGDRVYMHCSNGDGRTGTVAALILGVVYGISSSEALSLVQQYRDMRAGIQGLAVETHQQRAQVHRLLKSNDWRDMVRGTRAMRASASNISNTDVDLIMQDLRAGLMRRGPEAFIKLRRLLQQRDFNKGGRVSIFDLTESLRFLGRGVRDGDVVKMTRKYDPEDTGTVNYHEILKELRGGEMPAQRVKVCRDAFDKIGQQHGTSRVTLLDLKRHFRTRNDPAVRTGKLSEDESVSKFLDTFFNAGVTDKQIVTWEDFLEYYACVGAAFDQYQDRAFMVLVWETWGLQGTSADDRRIRAPAGGRPAQRDPATLNLGGIRHSHDGGQIDRKLEEDMYEYHQATRARAGQFQNEAQRSPQWRDTNVVRLSPTETMDIIRKCLVNQTGFGSETLPGAGQSGSARLRSGAAMDGGGIRKNAGPSVKGVIDFVVKLRSRCDSGGTQVGFQDFLYALQSSKGLPPAVTHTSLQTLFNAFCSHDTRDPNMADSRSIIDALCGRAEDLAPMRRDLIAQAFRKLDQGTGRVHIRDVAKAYSAKKHPEVVSGRHSSDDVFFWFFDGFRKLCASADGLITLNMFEDYYRIVSEVFPDDNYFRILLWSVWELAGGSRIGNGTTRHTSGIIDRANPANAGSHKPGPAHRASTVPIINRSADAQRIVDSVAEFEDSRLGGGGATRVGRGNHATYGATRQRAFGIVPNSGESRQFQHKSKRGTDDAVRRTYQSHIHGLLGGGPRTGDDQKRDAPVVEPPSDSEVVSAVSRNILASLRDRGVHGFVALLRAFEGADEGNTGNLPLNAFFRVLRASGYAVSENECRALFRQQNLSSGNAASDQIDYGAFVGTHLCGINLSQTRLAVIHQAFAKFDSNNNGFVPLEYLHSGYCAARHPDVSSGRRSVSQVQREFVENFTVSDGYGKVSIEAFEMYFKFVSACILEDADFQFLMWNVWNLADVRAGGQVAGVGRGNDVHAAGYSRPADTPNSMAMREAAANNHARRNQFTPLGGTSRSKPNSHFDTMSPLAKKIYQANSRVSKYTMHDEFGNEFSGAHVMARLNEAGKLLGRKSWIGLSRAFRMAAPSGGLTPELFSAVLADFGLGISDKELQLIFKSFDEDGNGRISYDEFMRELRGALTGERMSVVRRAFNAIDRGSTGKVALDDLCRAYNAKADHRVLNGDLTSGEAIKEFMDTFDFNSSSTWITFEDFLEYYTSISATIADDSVFSLMIWQVWLSGKRR